MKTPPNKPDNTIDSEVDEILETVFDAGYKFCNFGSKSGNPPSLKKTAHTITNLIAQEANKAAIKELETVLRRSNTAWVKRGEQDSHEVFVHANYIKDRLTTLKLQEDK